MLTREEKPYAAASGTVHLHLLFIHNITSIGFQKSEASEKFEPTVRMYLSSHVFFK